MAEALDFPGVAEMCEPSPTIITAGSRLLIAAVDFCVAVVVFLLGLVEGSAASLRFLGALFATSTSPEVIRSEIFVTAVSERVS